MISSRETIMQTLLATLNLPGVFATADRDFRNWRDVKEQPALFVCDPAEEVQRVGQGQAVKSTLHVEVWIYAQNDENKAARTAVLNELVDKVRNALEPPPGLRAQTLGGLVEHCWVEGKIDKSAGYLGKQAVAAIPVKILIPN